MFLFLQQSNSFKFLIFENSFDNEGGHKIYFVVGNKKLFFHNTYK